MDIRTRFGSRFEQLIAEGNEVIQRCWRGEEWIKSPGEDVYAQFRTEALNIIRITCGPDSDHYNELNRIATSRDTALNAYHFRHCLGVLKAAYRDFAGGYITDLQMLVTAEVFDDFLDQADHLLHQGYYVPAASLAGAVLEDTLRKICSHRDIPLPDRTSIDKLNAELARAGVYNKLIHKRITVVADVRNNADHGRFDAFSREDVADMLKMVRRFTADYLE